MSKHKTIKWSVPKKELESALDIIMNVPSRSGVSSSEYIKMSKYEDKAAVLNLTADVAGCSYLFSQEKYPFKSEVYLDRRLLEPFVNVGKELKGSEYIFELVGDALQIKHGSRRVIYAKAKAGAGYQHAPRYKKQRRTELNDTWTSVLRCAIACGTDDSVTPHLNCVYVLPIADGVKLYATNTKIGFIGKVVKKHVPKHTIAFPLKLATLSALEMMKTLVWDNKSAMISSPKGKIWQAIKIQARKNFPYKGLEKLASKVNGGRVVFCVDSASLSATANRIAQYLSAVTREDLILKMNVSAGSDKMKLTCGTGHTIFSEQVALTMHAKKDMTISWPLEEVLPALIFGKDEGEAKVYIAKDERTMYKTKHITLLISKKVS